MIVTPSVELIDWYSDILLILNIFNIISVDVRSFMTYLYIVIQENSVKIMIEICCDLTHGNILIKIILYDMIAAFEILPLLLKMDHIFD